MKETHISPLGGCSICGELVRIKQVIEDRFVIEQVKLNQQGEVHDCQQQAINFQGVMREKVNATKASKNNRT